MDTMDTTALLLELQEAIIYNRPRIFANKLPGYCKAAGCTLEAALAEITGTLVPAATS